jgi:hypothetical protein
MVGYDLDKYRQLGRGKPTRTLIYWRLRFDYILASQKNRKGELALGPKSRRPRWKPGSEGPPACTGLP